MSQNPTQTVAAGARAADASLPRFLQPLLMPGLENTSALSQTKPLSSLHYRKSDLRTCRVQLFPPPCAKLPGWHVPALPMDPGPSSSPSWSPMGATKAPAKLFFCKTGNLSNTEHERETGDVFFLPSGHCIFRPFGSLNWKCAQACLGLYDRL